MLAGFMLAIMSRSLVFTTDKCSIMPCREHTPAIIRAQHVTQDKDVSHNKVAIKR
jgi:hypothetical protein